MAVPIECHSADVIAGVRERGWFGAEGIWSTKIFLCQQLGPAPPLARDNQLGWIAQRQAHTLCEALGALRDQQDHMAFEHPARQCDRIAHAPHRRHRARAQRGAVHYGRVQLDIAVAVQYRADASVEDRRVFEYTYGRLDRVEGRAAGLQHAPANRQRLPAAGLMLGDLVVGDIPGAAVDDQCEWHSDLVLCVAIMWSLLYRKRV